MLLRLGIEVDAVLLEGGVDWAQLAHVDGTGDEFDFALGWFFVAIAVLDEVLLVILLVAVEVFAARKLRLEQDHDA